MDSETIVDRLLGADVLADAGEELVITDGFRESADRFATRARDRGVETVVGELDGLDEEWRETLGEGFGDGHALLGQFLALAGALPGLSGADLVRVLFVLDGFEHPPSRVDGTPPDFLPVRGDRLRLFLPFITHAVAYVWREDCEPCDVMVAEFDGLPESLRAGTLLVSVYGPGSAQALSDAFDVGGAPTTLFLANGEVDSRLVGAHPTSLIETEIRTAAERSRASIGSQTGTDFG